MTFKYNCFLEKHLTRKFPCFLKPLPQNDKYQEIPNGNYKGKNVTRNVSPNVTLEGTNVSQSVPPTTSKEKVHQCPTCLKVFARRQGKYKHLKTVKCSPPEPPPSTTSSGDVNINSHNNITNNITNNIKIVNWSKETYEHMTPEVIANIVRKCVNAEQPLTFFSEFPNAAHKGAHKNIRVMNIRGNYLDVYEDGKFLKLMVDYVMEDCAKRMIYRLEDAMGEDERAFKGLDNVSAHIIRMEDVVHGIPKKEACEKQLVAMDALEVHMRSDVLRHVKNGLWNVAR
tara:strand:- start:8854 stop:9705 length:852 start_codon:yes stop_codon:yes gene_type:complete